MLLDSAMVRGWWFVAEEEMVMTGDLPAVGELGEGYGYLEGDAYQAAIKRETEIQSQDG